MTTKNSDWRTFLHARRRARKIAHEHEVEAYAKIKAQNEAAGKE